MSRGELELKPAPFCATEKLLENVVVDAGKEANNVRLEIVRIPPQEILSASDGPVSALAAAAGVAVEDKTAFVDGLQDVDDRVMDDAVTKRSRTDEPWFRFVDAEVVVASRSPRSSDQLLLELQKLVLPVEVEADGWRLEAFTATTALIRQQQVVPGSHLRPQVAVCLCHAGTQQETLQVRAD